MPSRFKLAAEHLLAARAIVSLPDPSIWNIAFEHIQDEQPFGHQRRNKDSRLAASWLALEDFKLWDAFWADEAWTDYAFAHWAAESLCLYAKNPRQGDAPQAYASLASLISTNPSPHFACPFAVSLWHLAAYGCHNPPATCPIDAALAKEGLARSRHAWKSPRWTQNFFQALPEGIKPTGALGAILEEMALESEIDQGQPIQQERRL